jgi:hypothetical protein
MKQNNVTRKEEENGVRSYSDVKKPDKSPNHQGCKERRRRKKDLASFFFSVSYVRVIHHEMARLFAIF